jgi:hypothetical protein
VRILVCGGRAYSDAAFVARTLDRIHAKYPDLTIIDGGAPGADRLAREWAVAHGVMIDPCPVDHALDGPWPGAGPRRNQRMLETKKPDAVVGFSGDRGTADMGRGTADMCRRAEAAGVPVWRP